MLSSILRHRAVQPLKRATRNLWWKFKGRGMENPPLPRDVRSILFVCLGNICRSPFAEVIAAHRSGRSSSEGIVFASAGIRTKQAAEPPADAKAIAKEFGVSIDRHRPRALSQELAERQDMILVMDTYQMEQLNATHPQLRGRVFLLAFFDQEASGFERYNIEDPFGLPRDAYAECYRRIDRAVTNLLHVVSSHEGREQPVSRKHA